MTAMRVFLSVTLLLLAGVPALADEGSPQSAPLTRVVFGSCAHQDKPQPIWDVISAKNPDLLLLLGDNVYADSVHPAKIRAAYRKLAQQPGFQKLTRSCQLLATWDDHDYGLNDGGKEHPGKAASQAAFLDFFGVPAQSALRKQQGVYQSRIFGPPGQRVQILLLDTRYHRDRLASLTFAGRTIYVPHDNPEITMLGEEQWNWLTDQLRNPAELRLVVSSIQVLPRDHPFEKWHNLPHERRKLLGLLQSASGAVLILSGDQHLGELTRLGFNGFNFVEATSSGLTHDRGNLPAPNDDRVGRPLIAKNFGILEFDWNKPNPLATISICDERGKPQIQERYRFSELSPLAVVGGRATRNE